MSKIFRFVMADLVGLAIGLPLMTEALALDSICFLFNRFSLPGAASLLAFLATDPLLSFSARADNKADCNGVADPRVQLCVLSSICIGP